MNTTRKWKLVSLTSTTATTTIFSIYKNDHNKVCGGPMKELIQGSTWLTHLIPETAERWTRLSDFPFTFHFHALEKEMATHSSVLAWRIPGTGEPGGLPPMGSHRVRHDWSDLAAAAGYTTNWLDYFIDWFRDSEREDWRAVILG